MKPTRLASIKRYLEDRLIEAIVRAVRWYQARREPEQIDWSQWEVYHGGWLRWRCAADCRWSSAYRLGRYLAARAAELVSRLRSRRFAR